jgi:hypothetical protein
MAVPKMRDEEKAMSPSQMRAQTASELRCVPRGGFAQNMYRMVLQQCLINSLGQTPQIPSFSAAHEAAKRTVRETYPEFELMIRGS